MAAAIQKRLLTIEDYHHMVAAGILSEDERIELIRGELVALPPITNRHAGCVRRFIRSFNSKLAPRAVLDVQNPIPLEKQQSEPQPDIAVLRYQEDCYTAQPPKPKDVLLIVEISDSSLPYDRDIKIPLYVESGILEVWLVDLMSDSIFTHRRPSPTGYQDVRQHRRGETITPMAFPDTQFYVDEILG